jgi:uncharacterized repeat protein (TIGR01451 family)
VRLASGDSNSNNRLDLTETWRFTCTATLTQTTTNHASATASYTDIAVHDEAQATVTVATSAPGIRLVAAANPTSLPAGGGSVTYTYVVTNTGNAPLTTVTLGDNRCDDVEFVTGDTNGDGRLDINETWQYRCTTTVAATTTNTAGVSGRAGTTTVSDTDTATVAVTASNAAISVVKTANPISLPAGGGPVTYTYNVTNKGNVPLSSVSLIDDVCPTVTATGGDANANSRLDPTETWRYTCTQTLTETTTNTALATAFSAGLPVTDTDQALVTVGTPAALTPRVGLALTASPVDLPPGGGPVTFTYIVSNKGDAPLAAVSLVDDRCMPVTGPTGDVNSNGVLDLAENWTFTCTLTLTQTATNMATASAAYLGEVIQAVDMATVTVAPPTPTPNPTAPAVGPIVSGASGGSGGPGGSVAGATSPVKPPTGPEATVLVNSGSTPSGMVMILILLLGVAASVVIMTLSKRTSNS